MWQPVLGQSSKAKVSKGPRAVGLLELQPKGKARLIPVVILVDGQYYDAGAYKASPVPMALWAETEYEAFHSGILQGLFIVTEALENPKTHDWIGEGMWQTAESLAAKSSRKPSSSIPRGLEDDSAPPVLRHSGRANPRPPEPVPSSQEAHPTTQTQPAAKPSSEAPGPPSVQAQPAAQTQPAASTNTPANQPASASASSNSSTNPEQTDENDPNRPTLKRGKPEPAQQEPIGPSAPVAKPKSPAPAPVMSATAKVTQSQFIPAISDADGPEAHPYVYDIKPDDEVTLRGKLLALAADEVRSRAKQLGSELIAPSEASRKPRLHTATRAKPAQPDFDDVQFRVFDLSSSNEPTMVLTASARMPAQATESALVDLQYFVTLVARQDINGDIHKAFANVTDQRHLDVEPKFELIDAVDVDGDGRGELLFRKVYDEGSAYVVYRVIGDQLYALFEGTPGE